MALKVQQGGQPYSWLIKTGNHYKDKCRNTLVYTTNRSHQPTEGRVLGVGGGGSFCPLEFRSMWLSCFLYTFL